jgi:hypothetical protein
LQHRVIEMQRVICITFLLCLAAPVVGGQQNLAEKLTFIENDQIRVGVDLNIGGAITHASSKKTGENLINSWDWGRQIQMSCYSGPANYKREGKQKSENWANFPWNPVQAGDHFGTPSKVLEHSNDGKTIYLKCIPMLWPMKDDAAECIFETWIELDGAAFKFRGRITNQRSDKTAYGPYPQENPAVYTNGKWHRLMTYVGDKPFENAALTEVRKTIQEPWPWMKWIPSEHWSALVDDNNFGIGVWSPQSGNFDGGFSGTRGKGGPKDAPAGYMAPMQHTILDHNIANEYSATFIVGTLDEIRAYVYTHADKNPPAWNFSNDRQNWTFVNARDGGWPIQDGMKLTLGVKPVRLSSPICFWKAEDVPKLYIRAAFKSSGATARICFREYSPQLFTAAAWGEWQKAWWNDERSITFEIKNDGSECEYVVELSKSPAYKGVLSGLSIELSAGANDDTAHIKVISLLPFELQKDPKKTDGK